MRLVHVAEDGALELNYMWLPSFIGTNFYLQVKLKSAWKRMFPDGVPNDERSLDEVHERTIDWFCEQLPIKGLRSYLSAISNIEE